MRSVRIGWFGVVAVLAVLPGIVRADTAGDEAKIKAQAQAFAAAWGRHDAKAMAGIFAEKGTLINPSGRLAVGRAEVEKLFAEEAATIMAGTTYEATIARIDWVTPDVAVVLWDAVLHGEKGPDGKPADVKHQVTVVEHRAGAGWEAVAGRPVIYLPPPPPPPAK
jgi:uncharacterized protein (TIGR02246 family)